MRLNFSKLGLALFVAHVGVVFWVCRQHFEGGWGGFFLFLLDFPVSLFIFLPVGWNQWLFFGVIGSFWWYAIGLLITAGLKRLQRKL